MAETQELSKITDVIEIAKIKHCIGAKTKFENLDQTHILHCNLPRHFAKERQTPWIQSGDLSKSNYCTRMASIE